MKRFGWLANLLLLLIWAPLSAQSFVNGSLNGTIAISSTPTSWLQVPYLDPVSQSTMTLSATSDVTGTTGPMMGTINGNPYHGTTLVSGLHMQNGGDIWHEGLMQTVTGLVIGQAYNIRFYQNVIKQSNATDVSGSWAVYRENTLIAISTPCTDNVVFGSNAHPWFLRTVTFTATATSHNIKFLPRDDDPNIISPLGVRMGIDSITLRPATPFAEPVDYMLTLVGDDQVQVEWEDANAQALQKYIVEHSPDGVHFEEVGVVEVGNGSHFAFIDDAPFVESYYRIGMVEPNGGVTFTEVKQVNTLGEVVASLYGRHLELSGGYGSVYSVTMRDMKGVTVLEQRGPDQADLSLLSPGIYFLRVISEGRENMILEKKIYLQ
ncbi:MAG: hypothetical protein RLZZ519_1914 [Bacteroidota bacterium]|jgi:hypothetical protein